MSSKKLLVMKFGGTSVANPERILSSAAKVARAKKHGRRVIVVVSAPGEMTDELIDLAKSVTRDPDSREMDMLLATGEQVGIALFAMALKARGVDAVSLTGPQAGILATNTHTMAKIVRIQPEKINRALSENKAVVVAGFQGINPHGEITTLGRGGSDLTAVALASAFDAEACEIYTDVEGVYTADPRLVPTAKKIHRISYDAMLELASAGAQVMQPRSIEVAKRFGVPIHVKCSFTNEEGTWIMDIKNKRRGMEEAQVSGVALDRNLTKLTVKNVPDRPGAAAQLFAELAKENIPVDMIVQSAAREKGVNDISITVNRGVAPRAHKAMERACRMLGAEHVAIEESCAKVSVVGTGLRNESILAAKVFQTLADHKINIQMIANSDIKIACLINANQAAEALRALHDAFHLGRRS
ncbi:MAG: aspartate kinase [Elusimicrobia bacterium]|nr:aspartate kinase [Elusimicrobiota bacterium]